MSDSTWDPVRAIASLDEPNRHQLYELVAGLDRPVGRDEAATTVGISRELAAFHLDRLVSAGLLDVEYRRLGARRGPGAGRPAKLYRRTTRDLGISIPQRDYERAASLFAGALDRVSRAGRPSALRALAAVAHERGLATGVEARASAGPRPGRRRLRGALVDLLRRAGYTPEASADGRSVTLRNCPYDALVATHREMTCGMNVAWADGVLEGLGGTGLTAAFEPTAGRCCVVFQGATT